MEPTNQQPAAEAVRPESEAEVVAVIADAIDTGTPLEVVGCGSKRRWGQVLAKPHTVLSTRNLSGIRDYSPDELVMTCGAGTLLSEIEQTLAEKGQRLPFAPGHWPDVLAGEAEGQTIGGVLATNLAGATRFRRGAARDYLLGFTGVSGRGESFKAGGRVMKNVTGYDLCKLMCGSFGTLAVMTEVSLKVLPAPAKALFAHIPAADPATAATLMHTLRRHAIDIAACWYLPEATLAAWPGAAALDIDQAGVLCLIEGPDAGLAPRLEQLRSDLGAAALASSVREVQAAPAEVEQALSSLAPLTHDFHSDEQALIRVSTAPTLLPDIASEAQAFDTDHPPRLLVDCSGHWLWLQVGVRDLEARVAHLRHLLRAEGALSVPPGAASGGSDNTAVRGHVAVVYQPEESAVEAFSRPPGVVMDVNRRIRQGFDPRGILNPGRLYPGE